MGERGGVSDYEEALRREREHGTLMNQVWQRTAEGLAQQRNDWIKLFNRLDAAVARHHRDHHDIPGSALEEHVGDETDEALWAAHDRILKAASKLD